MTWRNDLEIIGHHVETGGVWAGDQIDKVNLRNLCSQGYVRYDPTECVYVATQAGVDAWRRWRRIYAIWLFALRIKWCIRETLTP